MVLTLAEGKELIHLVRTSIEAGFDSTEVTPSSGIIKKFSEKLGVFVTLHKHKDLRGCIGFPEPVLPLYEAVIESSQNAAFGDPRFMPITKDEYQDIVVEISVLTKPELISVSKPEEYPKHIAVGKDGLIIRSPYGSGLLLPQVATEWKWNETEFLNNTCLKAGLSPSHWKQGDCRIYTFHAQIFKEEHGKVIELHE